jgi:hypothetical protein
MELAVTIRGAFELNTLFIILFYINTTLEEQLPS